MSEGLRCFLRRQQRVMNAFDKAGVYIPHLVFVTAEQPALAAVRQICIARGEGSAEAISDSGLQVNV